MHLPQQKSPLKLVLDWQMFDLCLSWCKLKYPQVRAVSNRDKECVYWGNSSCKSRNAGGCFWIWWRGEDEQEASSWLTLGVIFTPVLLRLNCSHLHSGCQSLFYMLAYFILKLLETEIITRLTGLLFTVLIILESLWGNRKTGSYSTS